VGRFNKIVRDINVLKQVSEPVRTAQEALEIVENIKSTLDNEPNGVGLAAIQIGIPKTIAVLKKEFFNSKEYFCLINPKIIEAEEEFLFFNEGCLSFPGQFFNTYRYKHLVIENDRIDGDILITDKIYLNYPTEKDDEKFLVDNKIVTIAIQHELDHFKGKIITEFCVKSIPIERNKIKVGRNDPCPCGAKKINGEPIKYKKCCGKNI
jgi:peptide deformylase